MTFYIILLCKCANQKPGFGFWSAKVEHLTQENLDVIRYAWAKPTLAWDGWLQQWWANGNTRETELHCLYGQPESTVPTSLFCTHLGQQQEPLLRRLFCDVPSVVCAVLCLMGSSGWRVGWMDGSIKALPVVSQLLHHPAPKQWGMLQEVSSTGSWPVSFALALSDYIVSEYNCIWLELQTISTEPCLMRGAVNPMW